MKKIQAGSENFQESFSTDVNQSGTEDERKSLLFKLNPKIQQIFGGVDFDYSDLFIELAVFPHLEKEVQAAISDQEKKKNFFLKNYERVLIHFFQFLFDFELQTLHFTQKYETIPSFAQWLESQVIFFIPDSVKLLNKKKNQSKKEEKKEVQIRKSDDNIFSPKRSLNKVGQSNDNHSVSKIESPKKVKVTQEGTSFVDCCSKYDEVTNHTANYTPKQTFFEREILQEKNQAQARLKKKQVKPKRKVVKVKQISLQKKQVQKKSQNNPRKESYTLKSNFTEKRESRRISSIEKQKVLKISNKQKSIIQEKSSKEVENSPQIIILQSSGEQNEKQPQKKNEVSIISVSECSAIQQISPQLFKESQFNKKPKKSPQILNKSSSIQKFNDHQSEQKKSSEAQKIKQISKIKGQKQKKDQSSLEKLQEIVQEIKNTCNYQSNRENEIFQEMYRKRQQRKLHNFRSRLSGLFRYPEKRFYIFPEMIQDYEKKQDDDIENRKFFDFKSMSKSKSLRNDKKENSQEKKNKQSALSFN